MDRTVIQRDPAFGSFERSTRAISTVLAGYALFGGLISFLAWPMDRPPLADWFDSELAIQPNAAVATILAGAGLFLLILRPLSFSAIVLGSLVFLIGLATHIENVTGADLGFDTLLMFGREWGQAGVAAPGRMGTPAAISWTLLGGAILLVSLAARRPDMGSRIRWSGIVLALMALSISIFSLIGHLFSVQQLYATPGLTAIALQTATFIFAIALAIVLTVKDVGPTRVIIADSAAGSMARRLLPVVAIPFVIGVTTNAGRIRGAYDANFAVALRTIIETIAYACVIWWAARAVASQEGLAKASEKEAHESARQLTDMADAMPQVVWIADSDGVVRYYNSRVGSFSGVAQVDGSFDWSKAIHPDDLDGTRRAWIEAASASSAYSHEHRILMADGTYRWHLSRAVPAVSDNGRPAKWYGTATDIHDLKIAEDALRKSEERLRLAVAAGNVGTWEADLTTRDMHWDVRAREIFGVPTDAVVRYDETFWKLIPKEEHPIVRVATKKATDPMGTGVYEVQHRVLLPDGSMRWLHNMGRVEFDGEGRSRRAVRIRGTVADITDRKQEEIRTTLLARLGDLIRTTDEPESLLYQVSRAVGETFHVKRCLFNEIDLDAGEETVHRDYCDGVSSVAGVHNIHDYSPVTLDEMKQGKTVVNMDSRKDPRTSAFYTRIYKATGERSYVAVPLMRGGVWVASLWISHTSPRQWTEAEVRLIESVGERTWLAVERLRSEEALRSKAAADAFRVELGEALRPLTTSAEVHRTAARVLCEYLGAGRCAYLEAGEGDQLLTVKLDHSVGVESLESKLRIADLVSILEELREGKPRVINDVRTDPRLGATERTALEEWDIGAFVGAPVVAGGRLAALVAVHQAVPREWTADEVALIIETAERVWTTSQRIESEQRLQTAHERFVLAQNAGRVGVWDWDVVSDRTYWSETMWALYGEKPSQFNPDEDFWGSHLHPDDRERVKTNLHKVVGQPGREFRDEFRVVLDDGAVRWMQSVASVERDPNGRAVRVYGVNVDITERKDIEQRVIDSENQLRLITDAMPALISYIGADGRYRFVNRTYTEWFGIEGHEIVGKTVREIVGANAYKTIEPYLERVLKGEMVSFEEMLHYRAAGDRYVQISYVPDRDSEGHVAGFYALVSDLTELKRSEDLLRSTEARMAQVLETVTDYAILTTDPEGRVATWNRGAELIFDYPGDDILGRSHVCLFISEDVENGVPLREMQLALQEGRAASDRWMVKRDGTQFFASFSLMPLYIGGSVAGYAMIAADLTEKQRRAEELQRARDELEVRIGERTRELAAANIALRQEMEDREVAERHRVDLLRRLVSSQEFERRRIARDIHDQLGQRLTALRLKIASLREISDGYKEVAPRVQRLQEIAERLDSEVSFMSWQLRPTSLDDLGVSAAIGEFVNEWSKYTEIAADFHASDLAGLRIDREAETHLYRITQEALNNIAKHAQAKHVTVLIERREDHLILIIEDDGSGFDPSQKSNGEPGSGLGLVGMGERARLVGGDFEIESAQGQGTTIYVRIPFLDAGE